MLDDIEKQDLRHAILAVMAERPRLYFTAEKVLFAVRRLLPFKVNADQCRDALTVLIGLGYVESDPDPFGSEQLYHVTAEGVLFNEREK